MIFQKSIWKVENAIWPTLLSTMLNQILPCVSFVLLKHGKLKLFQCTCSNMKTEKSDAQAPVFIKKIIGTWTLCQAFSLHIDTWIQVPVYWSLLSGCGKDVLNNYRSQLSRNFINSCHKLFKCCTLTDQLVCPSNF